MMGPEPTGVIAIFANLEGAESAVNWLRVDGLDKREVSILGPATKPEDRPPELDDSRAHQREVASYWASWGALVGALAGGGPLSIALAAATVGIGPLAAAVAVGAAAVAAASGVGALGSALVGLGIHERQAHAYQRALEQGKFLIVVHSDQPDVLRIAARELQGLGAESVEAHGIRL